MKTITIKEKDFPVYCTVEEADEYFYFRIGSSWGNLSEEDKQKCLVEATRKLDTLKFEGFPVETNQPLAFPRYFRINTLSKNTFTSLANRIRVLGTNLILVEDPKEMKAACCEVALYIADFLGSATQSKHIKHQRMGISSINVGGGTVSYTGAGCLQINPEAMQLIDKFLIKTARVV